MENHEDNSQKGVDFGAAEVGKAEGIERVLAPEVAAKAFPRGKVDIFGLVGRVKVNVTVVRSTVEIHLNDVLLIRLLKREE